MLIELIGGPSDGELISRSSRPAPLVWVDADLRLWSEPDRGRTLYKLIDSRAAVAGDVVLTFLVLQDRVRCEGCGWFVPRDRDCVMCDTRLRSAV